MASSVWLKAVFWVDWTATVGSGDGPRRSSRPWRWQRRSERQLRGAESGFGVHLVNRIGFALYGTSRIHTGVARHILRLLLGLEQDQTVAALAVAEPRAPDEPGRLL